MSSGKAPSLHRVFLLTVWAESNPDSDSGVEWRFRLEDAKTGKNWGFVDAVELIEALDKAFFDENTTVID